MSPSIRALVKNTDDDDPVTRLSVENNVLAGMLGAQTHGDVIPWRAQAGGVADRLERVFDLAQVFTLLGDAPPTPRIVAYPFQVCLRGVGYTEFVRLRQRTRLALRRNSGP